MWTSRGFGLRSRRQVTEKVDNHANACGHGKVEAEIANVELAITEVG